MDFLGYFFHALAALAVVLIVWILLGIRHLMNIAFTTRRPNWFLTLPVTWILDKLNGRKL